MNDNSEPGTVAMPDDERVSGAASAPVESVPPAVAGGWLTGRDLDSLRVRARRSLLLEAFADIEDQAVEIGQMKALRDLDKASFDRVFAAGQASERARVEQDALPDLNVYNEAYEAGRKSGHYQAQAKEIEKVGNLTEERNRLHSDVERLTALLEQRTAERVWCPEAGAGSQVPAAGEEWPWNPADPRAMERWAKIASLDKYNLPRVVLLTAFRDARLQGWHARDAGLMLAGFPAPKVGAGSQVPGAGLAEPIFVGMVRVELEKARAKFGPQRGPHEALGVIREEYLDFEKEVFAQKHNTEKMLSELVQVAAMCQRAAEDLRLFPQTLTTDPAPGSVPGAVATGSTGRAKLDTAENEAEAALQFFTAQAFLDPDTQTERARVYLVDHFAAQWADGYGAGVKDATPAPATNVQVNDGECPNCQVSGFGGGAHRVWCPEAGAGSQVPGAGETPSELLGVEPRYAPANNFDALPQPARVAYSEVADDNSPGPNGRDHVMICDHANWIAGVMGAFRHSEYLCAMLGDYGRAQYAQGWTKASAMYQGIIQSTGGLKTPTPGT